MSAISEIKAKPPDKIQSLHCNLLIPSQSLKPAAHFTNTSRQAAFLVTCFRRPALIINFDPLGSTIPVRWWKAELGGRLLGLAVINSMTDEIRHPTQIPLPPHIYNLRILPAPPRK